MEQVYGGVNSSVNSLPPNEDREAPSVLSMYIMNGSVTFFHCMIINTEECVTRL